MGGVSTSQTRDRCLNNMSVASTDSLEINWERAPLNDKKPLPFSQVSRKTAEVFPSVSMDTVSHTAYGSINLGEGDGEKGKKHRTTVARTDSANRDPVQPAGEKEIVLNEHQLIELRDALQKIQNILDSAKTSQQPTKRKRMLRLPKWLVTDFLLFTFVLQIVVVGILTIVDGVLQGKGERANIDLICNILMMIIEGFHFILMASATVQLARQIILRKASFWFLVQCFLSSVLLYAGIYTLIYRFDKDSFIHFEPYQELDTADKDSRLYTLLAFLQGLYLSVSTATLCGGSQIAAQKLYSTSVVSTQMLLSFMYFASILSEAISASNPRKMLDEGILIRIFLLLKKAVDKIRELLCCCCCCCDSEHKDTEHI